MKENYRLKESILTLNQIQTKHSQGSEKFILGYLICFSTLRMESKRKKVHTDNEFLQRYAFHNTSLVIQFGKLKK